MNRLIIIGAGGHGRVIADAAQAQNCWSEIVFVDDKYPHLSLISGYRVVGLVADLDTVVCGDDEVIIGVGAIEFRQRWSKKISLSGFSLARVVHPLAVISPSAKLGVGTVVFANAVINAGAVLGEHVIINTSAVVEHDCHLSDYVHLSPGALLGGGVVLGGGFGWGWVPAYCRASP